MKSNRNKKILAIFLILLILVLGGAGIYVAILLQKAAVPTAPPSRPRAAEFLGGDACNIIFAVETATAADVACEAKETFAYKASGAKARPFILDQKIETVGQDGFIVYSIKVKNNGAATAGKIVITDSLTGEHQDLLTYVDGDSVCEYGSDTRLVTCRIANLEPGQINDVSFRVKVSAAAANGQIIKNSAKVTFSESAKESSCNANVTISGPTPTPTVTVTVTPTVTATTTPTATATITATATPTITATPTVTATVTPQALPEAGVFNLPGAAVFGGGLILTVLGILFAL